MLQKFAVFCSLLICAYLEFAFYPGHSFLAGSTQVFVPMLERLQEPGLLSRDLVATHPIQRYTNYDEATLFLLRVAHLPFEQALAAQQFAARVAETIGFYLLARAAGAGIWGAILSSAFAGFGAWLPGALVSTADREPVPYGFAFAYMVLSLGLFTDAKVLLCGLAGGIALLYSPGIAVPVWLVLILGCAVVKGLRPALRPTLTTFLVFGLLLANLAQLQPGAPGAMSWWAAASWDWLRVVRERTPEALPEMWAHAFWLYLAAATAAGCAAFRLWPRLNLATRWIFAALLLGGLLSMPVTVVAQRTRLQVFTIQTEPTRMLLFTVGLAIILCGALAGRCMKQALWREAAIWLVCAGGVAGITFLGPPRERAASQKEVRELADWALRSTWGGSLFLFPHAEHGLAPGVFRALSLRSVYVDWQGGELTRYYSEFGIEWRRRWEEVRRARRTANGLGELLEQPIDYFVLDDGHELAEVRPVFRNRAYLVYDARDLRSARPALHTVSR